jgi:hypothetical protein
VYKGLVNGRVNESDQLEFMEHCLDDKLQVSLPTPLL